MVLLILIVLVALTVSALCSVLEASLLSASTVELSSRADHGDKGAGRMLALREKHLEDGISAILTYNTIAHTVGAALSGAQAAVVFGDAWVGVFSGVLTLLILVFTEIIPKTVGTVYAAKLAGFSSGVIALMIKPPMQWLLIVTRALTSLVAHQPQGGTTRRDVVAMVKIAERDGALPESESTVLSNVLKLDDMAVREIMTPRTVLAIFELDKTVGDLLADTTCRSFSRIPVFSGEHDNVVGFVLFRDILEAALIEGGRERPLSDFTRHITALEETDSVLTALRRLTDDGEHLAVVLDELGVLGGVLTLEDIFETALGTEIVDELDEVADLRVKAQELREKRLTRLRARREGAR